METLRRFIVQCGLFCKLAVFVLVVAWTGIFQDSFEFLRNIPPTYYEVNHFDNAAMPQSYDEKVFEPWKVRRAAMYGEMETLASVARSEGAKYSLERYFVDLNKMMDLEDKYHMQLDGAKKSQIVSSLQNCIPRNGEEVFTVFIKSVQKRHDERNGGMNGEPKPGEMRKWFLGALLWLIIVYLKLMLMAAIFYLIRFIENGEQVIAVFAAAPWIIISRIIFWPNWWMSFPNWDDKAELYRYLHLKTHFLRTKPFGYFVTATEDDWLKERAKREGEAFEESLKQLLNLQINLGLPRKTIAIAVCSLVIGTFIQPVLARGSNLSDNVKAVHSSLEKIHVDHLYVNGVSPPGHDHLDYGSQPALMSSRELTIEQSFFILFVETVKRYIQPPSLTIEHIPLSRSV